MKVDSTQAAQANPSHETGTWLRLFKSNDPNAPGYRARMIKTVLDLTPFSMGSNALNALVLVWLFAGQVHPVIGVLWLSAITLQITRAMGAWFRSRGKTVTRASERGIRHAIAFATVQGITWGLVPVVLFESAPPGGQLIIAVMTTGMICAGAFVLSAIRAAAISYALILGTLTAATMFSASSNVSLSMTAVIVPLSILMAVYCLIVVAGIMNLSSTIVSRLIAETRAENQNHVIGLLLRDFEEHASDILWEVDEHRVLRHASPRLMEVLGIAENATTTMPFNDLLARVGYPDREGTNALNALGEVLAGEQPFRDVSLKLSANGQVRWWTITAKPLTSNAGHVIGWRGILADVTETRDTHESLVRLAHHCSLTNLANRHYFVTRLAEDLQNLSGDRRLAVLYVDLDDFKKVNDSFGHSYGDTLLKNISTRLQETVREDDLVARLGGDEFAVLLHDVNDETQAMSYAKRLLEYVEPAYQVNGTLMPVGMSVGVALAPLHGSRPDELMRAADLAMYAAKSAGKGMVEFYSKDMGAMSHRRRTLEEGLREVIERNELSLVYQPQISIESGQITAFEALLRWDHPALGTISPSEFIPIAEETGQIEAIGNWVLLNACRDARKWPAQIGVAVNVSAAQAMSGRLLDAVKHALAESRLNVRRLELEITESIFLSESPTTLRVLHELRDLGAKIALDDFGVGYSSLAYLRRFPFSSLKIDRAFTHEIVTSEQSRSIIRAIVALARSMGMTIIAEGVERPEQVTILNRLGADWAQGYLFAAPVQPHKVATTLVEWEPRSMAAAPTQQ
ncbi:MAG: putative bifunctional diguanylate cyclase/phosphodiesterase [Burkholderiaceae bacterium]